MQENVKTTKSQNVWVGWERTNAAVGGLRFCRYSLIAMLSVVLLIASNLFMTIAWYGHLKYKGVVLWKVIVASWLIAFFEYCLQVPANRWGYGRFSATQLKIMQEVISLSVFCAFCYAYLGEIPRWNHIVAFVLIVGAVAFAFMPVYEPIRPR